MKHKRLRKVFLLFSFAVFQIYFFLSHIPYLTGAVESVSAKNLVISYILAVLTMVQLVLYTLSVYRASKLKEEIQWFSKQEQIEQQELTQLLFAQKQLQAKNDAILKQLKALQQQLYSNASTPESSYLLASEIRQNFQNNRYRHYCSNTVIDAILHSKENLAHSKGIQVSYSISLPEKILLPDSVLVCIFFNLLDNGIEACERSDLDYPVLNLQVSWRGDMLFLNMKNSKNKNEIFTRNTRKKDFENHGLGLSIIEDLIQKNNGSAQWLDHGSSFESVLMLHYKQKNFTL